MRKLIKFTTTVVLLFTVALVWAQKTGVNPRRPAPVIQSQSPAQSPVPMATVRTLTATPATITFTANNPGGSAVAGSSTATVGWSIFGGVNGNTWTLSVYANSTTFTGCTTVPASAVGVSCSSATATGTNATATCTSGGPFTLPTTSPGQQVASGNEGTGYPFPTYSVVLKYQFTDSWEFIANTCPLTITYTANAP